MDVKRDRVKKSMKMVLVSSVQEHRLMCTSMNAPTPMSSQESGASGVLQDWRYDTEYGYSWCLHVGLKIKI